MITDEMIHGSWAGLRRNTRNASTNLRDRSAPAQRQDVLLSDGPSRRKRHPRRVLMDEDAPVVPRAVAEGVCEEAAVWLGSPLPTQWVRELTARAHTIYAHNERFRRRMRGAGNRGRDYLWMFMRHWLAALLKDRRPQLFVRLPASYSLGCGLPERRDHLPVDD